MRYVPPSELHRYWESIKKGLVKVLHKSQADWIPEDVFCSLRNGTSTLHVFNTGFVVLTPKNDFGGVTLFVWVAFGKGDVFEEQMPEIRKIAANMGARRIRFESSRPGWAKRFKYVTTVYEEELP